MPNFLQFIGILESKTLKIGKIIDNCLPLGNENWSEVKKFE